MDIDPAHYHLPPDSADYSHDEEQKHFTRIMRAFKNYRIIEQQGALMGPTNTVGQEGEPLKLYGIKLRADKKLLLKKFGDHFNMVRECILYNAEFIDEMILEAERMFLNEDYQCKTEAAEPVRPADMDKVDSTMVQLVRDWSGAGSEERKASYGMVVQALEDEFSDLLPELCSQEHGPRPEPADRKLYKASPKRSLPLLMSYKYEQRPNFMINRFSGELNSIKIYPWVPRFCNNLKAENQLKPVLFPDVRTSDSTSIANFTMIGGEFVDKEEVNVETPYACDMNSMNKNTFRSVFFVCRKPTNFEQS
ncbi:unnamed protein product [Notodromas monacha]|uniref:Uncharacterized protein n=1 Tax=Notodromas monacha TaxID=399045 RepID=A0A7R9BU90_9CRUS|nr:unnamed protein product [Notodromas monacha]CAG0920469.1 unnamed protein product [Notodromas monacha]